MYWLKSIHIFNKDTIHNIYLHMDAELSICTHTHNLLGSKPSSLCSALPSHPCQKYKFALFLQGMTTVWGRKRWGACAAAGTKCSLWGQSLIPTGKWEGSFLKSGPWFKGWVWSLLPHSITWHMEQGSGTLYIQPQQLLMVYLIICHRRRCYD